MGRGALRLTFGLAALGWAFLLAVLGFENGAFYTLVAGIVLVVYGLYAHYSACPLYNAHEAHDLRYCAQCDLYYPVTPTRKEQ